MAATTNAALEATVNTVAKTSFWTDTGEAFVTAGKWIANGTVYVVTWLKDAAIVAWDWLAAYVFIPVGSAFVTAWNWVAYTAAPAVWSALSPVLKPIGYVLYEIGKGIYDFLAMILTGVYYWITGAATALWSMACTVAQHIANFAVLVWNEVVALLGPPLSILGSMIAYAAVQTWAGIVYAACVVGSALQTAAYAVGYAFQQAGEFMLNFIVNHPWLFATGVAIVVALAVGIPLLVYYLTRKTEEPTGDAGTAGTGAKAPPNPYLALDDKDKPLPTPSASTLNKATLNKEGAPAVTPSAFVSTDKVDESLARATALAAKLPASPSTPTKSDDKYSSDQTQSHANLGAAAMARLANLTATATATGTGSG